MAELDLARLHGVGGFAKLVAIKRILPHLAQDRQFVDMFLNEGRIASQLSHPNVCQVYELGEVDGELFLAMEYLDGVSWDDLLAAVRLKFDPYSRLRLAAGVLAQAAEGLHYAHQLRDVAGNPCPVIHRDVSPQNLFVTVDGVCKVLDFGVSKMMTDGPRTRTGLLKGKLPYMSPEQIRGEHLDARGDVFALGVVAWEALTGARLFERDTDFLVWKAIGEEPIPTVTSVCRDLPPAIDGVIGRALERDRDRRYDGARPAAALQARRGLVRTGRYRGARAIGVRGSHRRAVARRGGGDATRAARAVGGRHDSRSRRDGEHGDPRRVRRGDAAEAPPLAAAIGAAALVALLVVIGIAIGRSTSDDRVVAERSKPEPQPQPAQPMPEPETVRRARYHLRHAERAARISRSLPRRTERGPAGATDGRHDAVHAPVDRRPPVKKPLPRIAPPAAPAAEPTDEAGMFSVDSKPYATIYVDDRRLGDTPLFRVLLPPGDHRVRAALADGRERSFIVHVESGKDANSGQLAW
jgi:serine/threonine-protein kinase